MIMLAQVVEQVAESKEAGWIAALGVAAAMVVQAWWNARAKATAEQTKVNTERDHVAVRDTLEVEASSNAEYAKLVARMEKQYRELKNDLNELVPKYVAKC